MGIREDAEKIMTAAIASAMPKDAVRRALEKAELPKRVSVVAIGKAAWQMAKAAQEVLGARIANGVVITKYGHSQGSLSPMQIYEAGHPIPDENGVRATEAALALAHGLGKEDTLILLVSGGGSALFESPLVALEELQDINGQLLACGADITEINVLRKRLSAVKGGRFAQCCAPAHVFSVVLSDIVGDPLDMIASGPACPDSASCADALRIIEKYALHLSDKAMALMHVETPKQLSNTETQITGSVRQLCEAAEKAARALGYAPTVLTDSLCCEAREAGGFLAAIARYHAEAAQSFAFIAGGETVVHLTGAGKGGRNQELALAGAEGLAGLQNVCLFSVGSDGTDGPTDAAGGIVDGETRAVLAAKGISIPAVLKENDAYNALEKCGALIVTGPTGTNVNDLCAVLIKR